MASIDLIPSRDSMGFPVGYALDAGCPLPFHNGEEVTSILRSKNTPEPFIRQAMERANEGHIVTINDDGVFSVKTNLEVVGQ